ncbi:phage head closure protein [Ralstonia solanacearum]|nr:hypothetical protein BCR16_12690 [Ralstonia solanacearum FJAT-1458]QKL72126.1 phage head closure protein [Ralstonia solanacearum]QKL77331.1 phage head closure protein [Ralstonia solanacearum]QKL82537.1 phage head closure protein [Ralstonia solanacearum]QKL87747.1 phage head closure protein [Ralstonia solanacearum]
MARSGSRTARKKGVRAGSLNNKVSLQRKASGRDPSTGQPLNAWTEYASVWGSVRQISGIGRVQGGTLLDKGTASIRIRYRTDVLAGDRAIAQGVVFHVASVLPGVDRREYTDLACTENAEAL